MRGEQSSHTSPWLRTVGSPPHARGAVHRPAKVCRCGGITPACAGSSCPGLQSHARRRDHPRMRGEQQPGKRLSLGNVGSPPHARGAVPQNPAALCGAGITPACAGSSCQDRAVGCHSRDHPRMRGEQCVGGATTAPRRGSPPHARGADRLIFTDQSRCRITPACAGSSHQQINNRFNDQDHPRMRGEQSPGSAGYRGGWGSPPHARGAGYFSTPYSLTSGITPACAGSSPFPLTI